MDEKPFSPSCERNRDPILVVLSEQFAGRRHVLEIGSGTGQHAVHFAAAMPWLTWQCSDRAENLPGTVQWLDEARLPNTPAPIELDVFQGPWPAQAFDAVFSANTLHIMGWPEVVLFFEGVGRLCEPASGNELTLAVYGPFNYGGAYTSESNGVFDASLRARDPRMGLRDFEDVNALAIRHGLVLVDDIEMPANNRMLMWHANS